MVWSTGEAQGPIAVAANALEPGTVTPIHWHHGSSETVVVLRGRIRWIFYDDNGNQTERVLLDAAGDFRMLNVEKPLALSGGWRGSGVFEGRMGRSLLIKWMGYWK